MRFVNHEIPHGIRRSCAGSYIPSSRVRRCITLGFQRIDCVISGCAAGQPLFFGIHFAARQNLGHLLIDRRTIGHDWLAVEHLIRSKANITADHVFDQGACCGSDVGIASLGHAAHAASNSVDQIDLPPGCSRVVRHVFAVERFVFEGRDAAGTGCVVSVPVYVHAPAGFLTRTDGDG